MGGQQCGVVCRTVKVGQHTSLFVCGGHGAEIHIRGGHRQQQRYFLAVLNPQAVAGAGHLAVCPQPGAKAHSPAALHHRLSLIIVGGHTHLRRLAGEQQGAVLRGNGALQQTVQSACGAKGLLALNMHHHQLGGVGDKHRLGQAVRAGHRHAGAQVQGAAVILFVRPVVVNAQIAQGQVRLAPVAVHIPVENVLGLGVVLGKDGLPASSQVLVGVCFVLILGVTGPQAVLV